MSWSRLPCRRATARVVRLAAVCAVLIGASCTSVLAQSATAVRKILVVHSYPGYAPGLELFNRGFLAGMRASPPDSVDFYIEHLDLQRFADEGSRSLLARQVREKYKGQNLRAIVSVADSALAFLRTYDLFQDVPTVAYTERRPPANALTVEPNVVRVWAGLTAAATIELALRLHPSCKRVVVLSGTPNNDGEYEKEVGAQLIGFRGRVDVTYFTNLSLEQGLAAVRRLPPDAVVLLLRLIDNPQANRDSRDTARALSHASSVPFYAVRDTRVGYGPVGGYVTDSMAAGSQVAALAVHVALGARPRDLQAEQVRVIPMFDWRQMQRWGILENQLPAGSTILHKQPSAWELYRPQIISASLVVLLQTAFIATLLVQRRRRMRVERALRESEERFRLMADTAPVLVWRTDADGLCDFVNRPWLQFTGRSAEQELGHGWREGIWPEDRDSCLRTYRSAFEAHQPFDMEYRLRRADGAYRWLFETGVPRFRPDGSFAGYIGSGLDITDRKASEDALREGQARYTLATAAGAVGVWDWNFEANEVYVDPTLKAILGFADAEITSRADDWGSMVHPDDVAMVTARVQACMDGDGRDYEVEHRMIHKDGSVRWFLSRGSLLRRADGRPHRMVGTKVDITERKRAEEAVREKDAMLRVTNQEIQHLAGRLILAQEVERARIARDLHDDTSQQLAALSIALSSLKRRVGVVQRNDDLQADVSSLQARTIALAENVRQVSHDLHPGVLEHVGLAAALADYCREVHRLQAITVTFGSEGDFDGADSDSALCMYRIAQEALRNVVRHAAASRADVLLRQIGDLAELTITDDGKGFDIGRSRDAKGLGLISINERVRLAGGTVSITTAVDKGTRVRVHIPMHHQAPNNAGGGAGTYAASA